MHRAAAAALLALAACAGGTSVPETAGVTRTTPALACFWYEDVGAAIETTDYTSCIEAGTFDSGGPQAGLQQLQVLSQAAGRQVILLVPACEVPVDQVESEITFWLQRISNAGYLKNIAAVRPCDEPDDPTTGHIDTDMVKRLTAVKAAMAKFPATVGKPIAIYYECGTFTRPGISLVDWMGCDRYDHGCGVFAEAYGYFEAQVAAHPGRKLMAISGGSDPWHQDPTCMVDRVLADGRFALLNVFAYQTLTDRGVTYTGVRDNGQAPLHRTQLLRLRQP